MTEKLDEKEEVKRGGDRRHGGTAEADEVNRTNGRMHCPVSINEAPRQGRDKWLGRG